MSSPDDSNSVPSPTMTFDEASAWHREEFLKLSIEERVRWLGEMLEVMDLAHEARARRDAEARHCPPTD